MVGVQRRQSQEQPQTDPQAALAVALVASTGATPPAFVAAIAPLLLPFVPLGLLSDAELAGDVAEEGAKLLYETDAVPVPAGGFGRVAALEALSYRAAYARAAVGRLSRAVLDAETGQRVETLRKAVEAEKRNLAAHVDMTRKRLAGARATDAMIELHGPILNWHHGATRRPEEPRPTHERADGMNVDLRRGIPASVGAAPGILPGCSCAWRPPRRGARMLV